MVVHLLTSGHGHGHDHHHDPVEFGSLNHNTAADDGHNHDTPHDLRNHHDHSCEEDGEDVYEVTQACFTCSHDPVGDLERLHLQADEIIERNHVAAEYVHDGEASTTPAATPTAEDAETGEGTAASKLAEEEQRKLIKMGINTAVAIGLHNFPEGLATFVAALDNPKVGAVLAVAIGIHNIPEGLCVALPIYYATGNRTKAFCWALLSGASEPVAALLGWAVLANSFSQQLFAILFGLVAGMMVIISTRELLPTAHRYDPDDTVVTFSFIVGMGVMALSLVLFTL
jgi:zinc transporter ZupT